MAQRSRHGFVEHQQSFADRSRWSEVEACARAPTVTLSSCRREPLWQDGPGSLSDRHLEHAADELLANAFSNFAAFSRGRFLRAPQAPLSSYCPLAAPSPPTAEQA
eukprot:scaffold60699_cov45-Phaeocystis_antarctica.AAC.2